MGICYIVEKRDFCAKSVFLRNIFADLWAIKVKFSTKKRNFVAEKQQNCACP